MYTTRNTEEAFRYAMAVLRNKTHVASVASNFHYDQLSQMSSDFRTPVSTAMTVTTANATDLPTSIALNNAILALLKAHIADALDSYSAGVHAIVDATSVTALAAAVKASDLATGITLANLLKATLNAHFTRSTVHPNNDGTNTVSATNASDQSSLNTLLNAIKTSLNAHVASAPVGHMIRLSPA